MNFSVTITDGPTRDTATYESFLPVTASLAGQYAEGVRLAVSQWQQNHGSYPSILATVTVERVS